MDRFKKINMIRKRNAELTKQLEDIRFKLEFDSQLNMEGYKRAKDLIEDLEKIKKDWLIALNDIDNKRMEYSYLINDLQSIKNIMINMGFKIPWYKKIINRLKSL